MDDEKLVIKAQNGDKEAFTSLIQKYKKEMYCIAKSRLDTEVDIDDAIQETLYKAYVNIRRLKDPKYFKTWIIRILYNNCSDITRSDKARTYLMNNVNYQDVSKLINKYLGEEYNDVDTLVDSFVYDIKYKYLNNTNKFGK